MEPQIVCKKHCAEGRIITSIESLKSAEKENEKETTDEPVESKDSPGSAQTEVSGGDHQTAGPVQGRRFMDTASDRQPGRQYGIQAEVKWKSQTVEPIHNKEETTEHSDKNDPDDCGDEEDSSTPSPRPDPDIPVHPDYPDNQDGQDFPDNLDKNYFDNWFPEIYPEYQNRYYQRRPNPYDRYGYESREGAYNGGYNGPFNHYHRRGYKNRYNAYDRYNRRHNGYGDDYYGAYGSYPYRSIKSSSPHKHFKDH